MTAGDGRIRKTRRTSVPGGGVHDVADSMEPDFQIPWGVVGLYDQQGGMSRARTPVGILNHFTATLLAQVAGDGGMFIGQIGHYPRHNVLLVHGAAAGKNSRGKRFKYFGDCTSLLCCQLSLS